MISPVKEPGGVIRLYRLTSRIENSLPLPVGDPVYAGRRQCGLDRVSDKQKPDGVVPDNLQQVRLSAFIPTPKIADKNNQTTRPHYTSQPHHGLIQSQHGAIGLSRLIRPDQGLD